ncbi:MAG: ATP-binding cassette domain-containing protein [Thermotogota bacterium]
MVKLKEIKVIYNKGQINEKVALENFSFQFIKGELITVIGANGSGKSTLFKVLTGDVKPQDGHYFLDNKNTSKIPSYKILKNISIVYQNPDTGVFPDLSIEENLILGSKKGNRFFKFGKIKGIDLLKNLGIGLEKRLKTNVKELSGGQKQALSLIIASISEPNILLLDEHTAALDPNMAEKIMTLTNFINEKMGITILMINHNEYLIKKYSKRILKLDNGHLSDDFLNKKTS